MKIKEVEMQTGITKANIRYYESQGLISPNRESNGYRTYDESHVKELLRIKLLRSLGLSIESIKALSDGKTTLEEGSCVVAQWYEQVTRCHNEQRHCGAEQTVDKVSPMEICKALDAERMLGSDVEKLARMYDNHG